MFRNRSSQKMSVKTLEKLGRTKLSDSFFFRDFLHSEISQVEKIPNIPHFPNIAIQNGRRLCENILEPLQDKFGRVSIRSGYRSPEVNLKGSENKNQYNCSSNEANFSRHIWDYPDSQGAFGAMTCIVLNSYIPHFEKTHDWRSLAWWILDNIKDTSELVFFPNLCAFNVGWHETRQIKIYSHIR